MIETTLTTAASLTLRYAVPHEGGDIRRVRLLLHGWTGDEDAMWVFVRRPPPATLTISPRGIVKAFPSGFGWFHHGSQGSGTPVASYQTAADAVLASVKSLEERFGLTGLPLEILGFSQGAALAGVLSVLYADIVGKTAILAGFLPPGLSAFLHPSSLKGKAYYVAHGKMDEIIPYTMAEEAAAALVSSGADVTFCLSDAGHKLSLDCVRGLEDFFVSG